MTTRTFVGTIVHDDREVLITVFDEGAEIAYRPIGDRTWGPPHDLTETTQGWVVYDAVTGAVVSRSFEKEEHANSVCREFNRTQGAGGRYNVRRGQR